MQPEEQPAVASAPAKRRTPLLIGIALAVLVALGGGGYAWHASHAAPAKDGQAKQAASPDAGQPEIYQALQPVFVVTFRDGEALRYLQVGVTLMSHDQKAIDVAKEADPVVRDGLVSLFSNQKFDVVSEAPGREKLQVDALATVRAIVKKRLGRPGIDALYFTSFVIQ